MLNRPAVLTKEEFSRLMARLGPFEARPVLAVATSGGADSLALSLMAQEWVAPMGGRIEAVTVDHHLRPASSEEARQVGQWLAARGIPHHVLNWDGPKPATGIEAAARAARYALLEAWCARRGILHLLLGHHQGDQAETVLLRLARGSGVDGLAAMPPILETSTLRLLRPFLAIPRERLQASLRERGQPWIEDPSNQDETFARVRMRRLLASAVVSPARLANTATAMARARSALERLTADWLVACVSLHEAGFAWLDADKLAAAPPEVRLRALSAVCRTVGGSDGYPLRLGRLERLEGELARGLTRRRTFAGCVIAPIQKRLLVMREARAMAPPLQLEAGERGLWDGRFRIRLDRPGIVAALGAEGWRGIRRSVPLLRMPSPVAVTLPALIDKNGVVAVPHLGFRREGESVSTGIEITFAPSRSLAPVGHCLV